MNKIKAIQKGTAEDGIYFRTFKTSYEIKNNPNPDNVVDEIKETFKITLLGEGQTIKEKSLVYEGFKDNKLVFTMTKDNLIIWYELSNQGRSEQFTCSCGIPPAIRLCEGIETCLKCGDELSK